MSQAPGNGGLNTFTGKWQRKTQASENGVYAKAPIGLYMSQASMEDAHDFQTEYGMPPAGGRAGSGKGVPADPDGRCSRCTSAKDPLEAGTV